MKKGIHPKVFEASIVCVCGNKFTSSSTVPKIEVDICSHCHPLFTGQQKFLDRAGRIEKFQERYAKKTEPKNTKK
ncbi:50S ribosomal protein L31 [Candidatus Babeliales bacterium]|nr:50S ribosomal protein L31 [Candidatus Babeliales bacterium]